MRNTLLEVLKKYVLNYSGDILKLMAFQKLTKWFTNQTKAIVKVKLCDSVPIKKPRAINAIGLFAQDHEEEVKAQIAKEASTSTMPARDGHLSIARKAKNQLFQALDEETKAHYETQATKHNTTSRQPAEPQDIYKYVTIATIASQFF